MKDLGCVLFQALRNGLVNIDQEEKDVLSHWKERQTIKNLFQRVIDGRGGVFGCSHDSFDHTSGGITKKTSHVGFGESENYDEKD